MVEIQTSVLIWGLSGTLRLVSTHPLIYSSGAQFFSSVFYSVINLDSSVES